MVIKLDKWDYLKLIKKQNINKFPRSVGFPYQEVIYDYDTMWEMFQLHNGVDSCFTSVNSYPAIEQKHFKDLPTIISVNNLFSDFDNKHKPENSLRDDRNLCRWLYKENLPFFNAYSGSKGFANYIILKPKKFKYYITGPSGKSLKKITYLIHLKFEEVFRMTTMDQKVAKDPKRISRMMYSMHSDKNGNLNGRHCYPLTMEQSLDWQIDDIVEYSYHPKFIIPECEGKKLDLLQLFEYLNIDIEEEEEKAMLHFATKNDEKISDIEKIETQLLLLGLEQIKPCIVNELMTINPDHDMRFAFAVYMKRIGKSIDEATQHYKNCADHFGYVDRHNTDIRDAQLYNIFNTPEYKSEPTCDTIINMGFCLGESCPRFHSGYKGRHRRNLIG